MRGVGGIDSWGSDVEEDYRIECGKGHCVRVYDRVGDLRLEVKRRWNR